MMFPPAVEDGEGGGGSEEGFKASGLLQAWKHSHLSLLLTSGKKSSNFIQALAEGQRDGGPYSEKAYRITLT